jgi:hypothetical protein
MEEPSELEAEVVSPGGAAAEGGHPAGTTPAPAPPAKLAAAPSAALAAAAERAVTTTKAELELDLLAEFVAEYQRRAAEGGPDSLREWLRDLPHKDFMRELKAVLQATKRAGGVTLNNFQKGSVTVPDARKLEAGSAVSRQTPGERKKAWASADRQLDQRAKEE